MNHTKYFFEIYKFLSYFFLIYFIGWFSERYFSINLYYFFISCFILIILQFIIIKKKNFVAILIIFFLLGNIIGQYRNFYLNIWLQNSLEQVKSHPIGFFLLKVKWKLEGKNIEIFFDRDNLLNTSKNIKNLKKNEKLVFSLDYMPPFIIYYDEDENLKKKKILDYSSNAGVIYSDKLYNFIYYNSQTGNLLERIKIENDEIKKIWSLKGNYFFHHWGDSFENKIYIPGRKYLQSDELNNDDFYKRKKCENKFIHQDIIFIIDFKTGKIIDEINIFDIILKSKLSKKFKDCINPIHLNDIEIVKKPNQLNYLENLNLGDYFISLRNIDTVLLMDAKNKEIKWIFEDELVMQHSPQITNRGTLLIFNNQGSKEIEGQSRIDEVDIKTKKIVGTFDGVKNKFYSEKRGRIQYLNNRIFIQESQSSNLFEILCDDIYISDNCQKKEIVTINSKLKDIFQSFAIDYF